MVCQVDLSNDVDGAIAVGLIISGLKGNIPDLLKAACILEAVSVELYTWQAIAQTSFLLIAHPLTP